MAEQQQKRDARFTNDLITAAQSAQAAYMVPASVSLAQWALESNWGKSMPRGSNNPFGIKAKQGQPSVPSLTHEVVDGRIISTTANFAKYASLKDAFEAHGRLLFSVSLYKPAIAAWKKGDLEGGIRAMAAHYATDPSYAQKLLSIINGNNLKPLDNLLSSVPQTGAPTGASAGGFNMGAILSSPAVVAQVLGLVVTYGPIVLQDLAKLPDVIAKAKAMIAALEKLDVAGAVVDLEAILAELGIDEKLLSSIFHGAKTLSPPSA